jgi:hypothetical protein
VRPTREPIAKHIIDMVKRGECGPIKLSDAANRRDEAARTAKTGGQVTLTWHQRALREHWLVVVLWISLSQDACENSHADFWIIAEGFYQSDRRCRGHHLWARRGC